jgi:hypothetical protein
MTTRREILFQNFRNAGMLGSDELSMVIDRMDRRELFPSSEAMDSLIDEFIAFVGGRMMARYDVTGKAPKQLRVECKLIIDD